MRGAASGSTGTRVNAGARRPTGGRLDDVNPNVDQGSPNYHGTVHGGTAFGKCDGALHGARTLTVDRHTCQCDDNRRQGDKTVESMIDPHGPRSTDVPIAAMESVVLSLVCLTSNVFAMTFVIDGSRSQQNDRSIFPS